MPIEEIRRIQQERTDQAAREKAAKEAAEETTRLQREAAERQKRETEENRRQFVIQQTEKILKDSGTLKGLQRIEREILEGITPNHQLSYAPDRGRIVLAWGSSFQIRDDCTIVQDNTGSLQYSSIKVDVDVDSEILTIQGASTYEFKETIGKI